MQKYSISPIQSNSEEYFNNQLNIHCDLCLNPEISFNDCIKCIIHGLILYEHENISEISRDGFLFQLEEYTLIWALKNLCVRLNQLGSIGEIMCKDPNCYFHKELGLSNVTKSLHFLLILIPFVLKSEKFEIPIRKKNCIYGFFMKKVIQNLAKKSTIIQYLKKKYRMPYYDIIFWQKLFPNIIIKNHETKQNEDKSIISKYETADSIFNVVILKRFDASEYIYQSNSNLTSNEYQKMDLIKEFLASKLNELSHNYFSNIGKKIEYISSNIQNLMGIYFREFNLDSKIKFSLLITVELLNLSKIFPLLMDPYIEEIFLDSKGEEIYLNHQKFSRCRTNIKLGNKDIEALKTHLRLESKKRLDMDCPSLIHVIHNSYFHCRFSMDIYPSHWKDFSLDIRSMRKKIFTIFDLIKLNTLNSEMAALIILSLFLKINISIVGEVDSGKTTLLNAIDILSPSNYRKIYVEETIETLENPKNLGHQLKYLVEPEIGQNSKAKENEIYKLLHRSGDLIILGEILSKNETQALFQCLSAGLSGIQTTHASSLKGLINRWFIHYDVNRDCINDLGILILMKKIENRRIALSISELFYDPILNTTEIRDFFQYNPEKKKWVVNFAIDKSKFLSRLNSYIPFVNEKINKILLYIQDSIDNILKSKQNPTFNSLSHIYPKLTQMLFGEGNILSQN